MTLAAHADENPLSDEVLKDLGEYRGLLPPVMEKLATSGLDGEHRERQNVILTECAAFLDSVIERRAGSLADRVAFARHMWPLMTRNAGSAARLALDSLHRQVNTWKGQLSAEEWNRLTVVVMGTQLPRKGNLAVQYFARLLGEPGEGRRIIYAEALFDEQAHSSSWPPDSLTPRSASTSSTIPFGCTATCSPTPPRTTFPS